MTLFVVLSALTLVLTKLLDVLSTLYVIKDVRDETNPLARGLMSRVGPRKAIWAVFILALGIIVVASALALRGGTVMQTLFLIAAILISLIQGAVALSNWQGKDNFITKYVRTGFSVLQRLLRGIKFMSQAGTHH
jgi:hypothetical protein